MVMTGKLARYIKENQLSVEDISNETHIAKQKLCENAKEPLNATEFLTLCAYLNIKPENL